MTLEDYNALNEMLSEFRRETEETNVQIDYNLRCIREAEAHLKSYQESESDDFKVFSPRRAETIHREEIEKIRDERSRCEENNKILYRRKEILNSRIGKLENVLSHQSCDFTAQEGEVRELFATVSKSLEELVHKINRSSGNIDKNPIQARQDFVIIGRDLKSLADKLRDTVSYE